MRILITGAEGFIGKNLVAQLDNMGFKDLLKYDIGLNQDKLDAFSAESEFVFHLAGINRPENSEDFMRGNAGFTQTLLKALERHGSKATVLAASSVQAGLDNPYGQSKKAGEDLLFAHAASTGAEVLVYRLPNVFGKWCRPNYNSAVATFCHNIARSLPVTVNDPGTVLRLVYIDDVVAEFIRALGGNVSREGRYCTVKPVHSVELGQIVRLLESFRDTRASLGVPNLSDEFTRKLYGTYLSYLPSDRFSYPLIKHEDARGSFTEFVITLERGQSAINIIRPGFAKGHHWHHTKSEKFFAVSGEGLIRFRALGDYAVTEYRVSGQEHCVVDIPPGYTHSIVNTGKSDLIMAIWSSERFDPENPDTYPMEV